MTSIGSDLDSIFDKECLKKVIDEKEDFKIILKSLREMPVSFDETDESIISKILDVYFSQDLSVGTHFIEHCNT